MITLEEFTKVLNNIFETDKYIDKLTELVKVDIFDTTLCNNYWEMINFWAKSVMKEEYIDTFNAYVWPEDGNCQNGYERDKDHPLELFYKDGAVNKIGTIEQLYNYIKENNGFRTNN